MTPDAATRDWDAITRGWVTDGVITAEQKPEIDKRLDRLPTSGMAVGSIVTPLIVMGAWLLIAGLVTGALTATVGMDELLIIGAITGTAAALLAGTGGVVRLAAVWAIGLLPLGRGLLAAAAPLSLIAIVLLDVPAALWLAPGVVWVVLGTAEGSRTLALTSALTLLGGIGAMLKEWESPLAAGLPAVVMAGCLFGLYASAIASRLLPLRAGALQVQAPVILATMVMTAMSGDFFDAMNPVKVLCVGVAALGAGLVAPAPTTLVPPLACLALSAVVMTSGVATPETTVSLTVVGALLVTTAALFSAGGLLPRR